MATKLESDLPSSPQNDESEGEQDSIESHVEEDIKPSNNNVADILKRLQSSGALLKTPKKEYRCFTCDEDFPDSEVLGKHLIQHVSLPSVVIDKLPSDDEDLPPSGDENWSEDEDVPEPPQAKTPQKTPQKLDISQIMKKTGLSIKKPGESNNSPDAAISKLSGLGFTIKKNNTPIKQENTEPENSNDVLQKLGKLGGIKLKLKSDGNNTNTFKVVNGLKDFKTSDEEGSGNEEENEENEEDQEKEASAGEEESGDEQNVQNSSKNSETDEEEIALANKKIVNAMKNLQGKSITPKVEPVGIPEPVQASKPQGRMKLTPKRGANVPAPNIQSRVAAPTQGADISTTSAQERRESQYKNLEKVEVKQEMETSETQSSSVPLFSGRIKSERASPPPDTSTPIIAKVKTETDAPPNITLPLFQTTPASDTTTPLLPITKTEDAGLTIIEINGDSNDEDDDCCVVSATPAPDVKPVIPKVEQTTPSYPPPAYPPATPSYSSPSMSRFTAQSTEKQHTFNWNAPDSKPPIDMLERSADDIFGSLLSSTKKEHSSLSDISEYISLDTLGPQHSCEVCSTRFTSLSLLDDHRRETGHSQSLMVPSSSSTLLPYNPSSNILSSLLPVKQLAEQVGKLSTMGTGPGFTHQQNVMINIQAYPGAGGVMGPPQAGNYYPGHNVHGGFQQPSNNMYGNQSQQMPGQYPGPHYMGQQGYGQQYQPPMSKQNYVGSMSQGSPYSTASPLQSMQQAVYGQTPGLMNSQVGQMGPPGMSPSHPYGSASSPGGTMKPPTSSGVKIQNVQTFAPGQMTVQPVQEMGSGHNNMTAPGQTIGNQMPAPGPIRMAAGANIAGARPRMPGVRGARPSIRPGIQVHGQVRGAKPGGPRMPMKRPAGMTGGPGQKRRNDMLLPGKHDNEDCHVMAMQKQRDGLPMIQSVQGAKDKLNIGSQISITKKTVNKASNEANAMANVLAQRGICIKQKQKSRSPSPERPVPHIPNLGAGMSIKHTSKSSSFSIPEAKVGGGMLSCKICKKMFMNHNSLTVHMTNAHPQSKLNMFKCDECPASYPKILQLQHHKRVFHNVSGPNRELGLPVVDLSQEDNLKRLSNLGIYSFIPLANREQASGCFGIPVISVHNMQNGMTSGLQALGADGLLSLGPLKPLPN